MTLTTAVELPVGLWADGARRRRAVLRPMTGRDEEFLAEAMAKGSPAHTASLLIGRCASFAGADPALAPAKLCAGDREALLLELRRLTYGDVLEPVVECPRAGCGERMDLSLRVSDLRVAPGGELPEYVEREFEEGYGARFRLPRGEDLEAVAERAAVDAEAAGAELLRRCVESVWRDENGARRECEPWPEWTAGRISEVMAELDEQAEITLSLQCPVCGHEFKTIFDAGGYLMEEVRARAPSLYREVHTLASAYHWSESEILGLTAAKRRTYLDLLFESFAREGRG